MLFLGMMLGNILLLDLYNTLGLPTSTTVSMVFGLLGAGVAAALFHIWGDAGACVAGLSQYIDAGKAIHLMGLVGTGGVHSHADHWFGVLEMANHMGAKEVYLHCITDGRDTDPHAGKGILANLQAKLDELGIGKIASVSGRYYAMDRDNNWDREEKA